MTNRLFNKSIIITLLSLKIVTQACQNKQTIPLDPLEQNLVLAGTNRSELEKVITHYQQKPADSLKLKSAIFLISNMENNKHYDGDWLQQYDLLFSPRAAMLDNEEIPALRDSIISVIGLPEKDGILVKNDLQHITSNYLIKNIDEAFTSWQNAPWQSQVSFDAFCNYILPYKVYDEYPEEWRQVFLKKYEYIVNGPQITMTMEDVICAQVEEQKTWLTYSEELVDYPGVLNIGQILKIKKGDCYVWASLGAQAARAFGIPVAIDYVWGHHWDALILSDSSFVSYLGAESRPGDHINIRESDSKFTKVYRRQTAWVSTSFAARAMDAGIKSIPDFLKSPRIIDVTAMTGGKAKFSKKVGGRTSRLHRGDRTKTNHPRVLPTHFNSF